MIQVMDSRKQLYNGTWLCDQARLEMTSVCLNKKPAHCNYLSGEQKILVIKRHFKFACNRPSGAVQEQSWLIAAPVRQGEYRSSEKIFVMTCFISCTGERETELQAGRLGGLHLDDRPARPGPVHHVSHPIPAQNFNNDACCPGLVTRTSSSSPSFPSGV